MEKLQIKKGTLHINQTTRSTFIFISRLSRFDKKTHPQRAALMYLIIYL